MHKPPRLIILLLFFCPVLLRAQDNNLLAKLAYENAETALSEKKFPEGISELKKVDDLLGKLTPKSQFLRVQLWIGAAETNGAYLDSAIQQSRKYLALAKSFEIPEEKQMETLRQLQKMEKDKAEYDKKIKAAEAANVMLQSIKKAAETRDQKVITILAGIDMEKDPLEQLTQSGRLSKKEVSFYKKNQTQYIYNYMHQGTLFNVPAAFYSHLLSTKQTYRVNGLESDLLVDICYTAIDGSFQGMKIELPYPASDIESYVNQISAILGFKPDAQVVIDASSAINYISWPFWSFKNYTVSLIKNSESMAKASGYAYSIIIARHNPNSASLQYNALLAPWN